MALLIQILHILTTIVGLAVVVFVLLQGGKEDANVLNALSGQSSLFENKKDAGVDVFLTRMTTALTIIFFILVMILTVLL